MQFLPGLVENALLPFQHPVILLLLPTIPSMAFALEVVDALQFQAVKLEFLGKQLRSLLPQRSVAHNSAAAAILDGEQGVRVYIDSDVYLAVKHFVDEYAPNITFTTIKLAAEPCFVHVKMNAKSRSWMLWMVKRYGHSLLANNIGTATPLHEDSMFELALEQ